MATSRSSSGRIVALVAAAALATAGCTSALAGRSDDGGRAQSSGSASSHAGTTSTPPTSTPPTSTPTTMGRADPPATSTRSQPATTLTTPGRSQLPATATTPASSSPTATSHPVAPGVDPAALRAGTAVVAAQCRPSPGSTVRQLPDLSIEGQNFDGTRFDGTLVDGKDVGSFKVPAAHLRTRVVDSGCVIYHDAPGGCLGAVDITGVTIPPARIPGFTVPDATLGGQTAHGVTVPAVAAAGVTARPVHQPQVCRQVPPKDSDYVSNVTRGSLIRSSETRASLVRASASRSSIDIPSGPSLSYAYVPTAYVPSVYLPSAYVPTAYLPSTYLPKSKHTTVAKDSRQTSYSTSADVLFDFGKATLKPQSRSTLLAVAAQLMTRPSGDPITVEGHTDSIGTDAANMALSLQRAKAVRDFVVTAGKLEPSRISVKGYGESLPVAPNTRPDGSDDPTGRAKNRRVVITAKSS